MTQEEILDYNKRCAEFLGWKQYLNVDERFYGNWKPNTTLEKPWSVRVERLFFDSDWNWIMEVLSKIEESYHTVISQGITGHYVNINREDVNILTQTLDNPSKFMGSGKTKKEAVVQAINQFLIWYEQNKTK